jgi:hypothetical protein
MKEKKDVIVVFLTQLVLREKFEKKKTIKVKFKSSV